MALKDVLISFDFFPQMGGAHTWMYEVYKRWPHPVQVLAKDYTESGEMSDAQAEFDRLPHGNLKIHRLALGFQDISLFSLTCLRQFGRLVKTLKSLSSGAHLRIHSLRAFPEGMAAVLYKKMVDPRASVVTYVHGEELNVAATSRQLTFFARQVLAGSDLVIVNSRATLTRLHEFSKLAVPIRILHPGVDNSSYKLCPQRIKKQRDLWGCRDDDIVLLTMARMEPRKNHAGVLRALALLRDRGLKPRYIMAGGGPGRRCLEELVHSLGLERQVLFAGTIRQEDKPTMFGAADIHIMASIQHGPMVEGFGIVFLEAAAAGIPSIAGNSGGQAEAVLDGRTGLVVDGMRVDELADAIQALAQDKALCQAMGTRGNAFALENDWDRVAQATQEAVVQIKGKDR